MTRPPRLVLVRHDVEGWCAHTAAVLDGLGCSPGYIARYLDSLRARARRDVVEEPVAEESTRHPAFEPLDGEWLAGAATDARRQEMIDRLEERS